MRYWPLALVLCSSLLTAQLARFRDPVFPNLQVTSGIPYGAAVSRIAGPVTLLLDLYEPAGDQAALRPAFVIVHGGGFRIGSRSEPAMRELGERFARAGYVAISIDYRLVPEPFMVLNQDRVAAVHDYQAAVRWLRSQAAALRIDETRIAAIGSSAGAGTVLSSAYMDLGEGDSGSPGFSSRVRLVQELWGAVGDVASMDPGEPPVFVVHGTEDSTVPIREARAIVAEAMREGIPYEAHPIEGAEHSAWTEYFSLHFDDSLAFAYEHLDLASFAGLSLRPGVASPGTATFDHHGTALAEARLALALASAPTVIPGVGTLWLDLQTLVVDLPATLSSAPRIATSTTSIPVPAGLTGLTLHAQALEITSIRARLTNPITFAL